MEMGGPRSGSRSQIGRKCRRRSLVQIRTGNSYRVRWAPVARVRNRGDDVQPGPAGCSRRSRQLMGGGTWPGRSQPRTRVDLAPAGPTGDSAPALSLSLPVLGHVGGAGGMRPLTLGLINWATIGDPKFLRIWSGQWVPSAGWSTRGGAS